MATFCIDLISGRALLLNKDINGGGTGTTSGATYMEVNTVAELPPASGATGEIYVVRTSTGAYVVNRDEAGLYYSNGVVWRRLGDIPSFFNSNNFQVFDNGDNTKGVMVQTSGITSGKFRTLTIQDADGTIAYLTDLDTKVDVTAFADYTGTTAPATFLAITDFNTYSATTLSLIGTKQDQLIAGAGIIISTGNTISVDLPDALQLSDISGGTEVNTIPQTPIVWTTQEYSGTSLSFTGGSRIYVLEDGDYEVSYNLNYEQVSGGRKNIGTVIRLTGNTVISPLTSSSYARNATDSSGQNTVPEYQLTLESGQYIELVAFRLGTAGSAISLPDTNWIKITKIL